MISSNPRTNTLNSDSPSPFSSPSRSTLSTSQSLNLARAQLSNLNTTIYPSKLSSLWANHFEPLKNDPLNEYQLSESDLEEWELNGVELKRDVERGIREVVGLWIEIIDDEPSREGVNYLKVVGEELERIQSGRPTTYLYSTNYSDDFDEEELGRRVEQADIEAKGERLVELDQEFEKFLDMMKMPQDARATLDHPSDPKDPESRTFRQLLRESWETMFAAEKGGVLGNFNRELQGLGELDLGMGRPLEPEDKIEDRFPEKGYKPGRIPLMTNHLLRDQLSLARARKSHKEEEEEDWFAEEEDPVDLQILPELSRRVSDDYLNFFQRAVKVDLLAKQLATRIISHFLRIPSSSSSTTSTGSFVGPSILLGGPFPEFIKKLDWVLIRCTERWLSPHQFALAAFGAQDGYFAVRKMEREVERLERVLREEEDAKGEMDKAREEL